MDTGAEIGAGDVGVGGERPELGDTGASSIRHRMGRHTKRKHGKEEDVPVFYEGFYLVFFHVRPFYLTDEGFLTYHLTRPSCPLAVLLVEIT
jgi:hypothetical protein